MSWSISCVQILWSVDKYISLMLAVAISLPPKTSRMPRQNSLISEKAWLWSCSVLLSQESQRTHTEPQGFLIQSIHLRNWISTFRSKFTVLRPEVSFRQTWYPLPPDLKTNHRCSSRANVVIWWRDIQRLPFCRMNLPEQGTCETTQWRSLR